MEYEGNIEIRGTQYQALAIESRVTAVLIESNTMNLNKNFQIIKIMDQIRSVTGIDYSGAQPSW